MSPHGVANKPVPLDRSASVTWPWVTVRDRKIIMADHENPDLQVESPKRHPGHERRAWVRLSSERDVSCRPIAGLAEASWLGTVRDISQGGVALILKRRFEPGTGLFVEVATNTGEL